ncbi:MAG: thiamine diphosphokinase [Oscillospiraceae bacterium]|nr:thiamine diphosphokinase [Oscillospiraceae bacterium]
MRPLCIIVGAMEPGPMAPVGEKDLLIAADGGLDHLSRRGLTPHLIVGDFDSLGRVPEGDNVLRHSVEKDDTDTMLAVKTGLARGYRTFLLYGCLGGRLDHAYANLQALLYLAGHGAAGFLLGGGMAASAVRNGRLDFSPGHRGTISVFCPNGEARGIDLTGLYYPLRDAVLTSAFPLGVSNQFTGETASVSVRDGALLVMWDHPDGTLPEQAGR